MLPTSVLVRSPVQLLKPLCPLRNSVFPAARAWFGVQKPYVVSPARLLSSSSSTRFESRHQQQQPPRGRSDLLTWAGLAAFAFVSLAAEIQDAESRECIESKTGLSFPRTLSVTTNGEFRLRYVVDRSD